MKAIRITLITLVLTALASPLVQSQGAKPSTCPDPFEAPLTSAEPTSRLTRELRERLFDRVHDLIRETYPTRGFYGVDWLGVREDYSKRVLDAATDQEVYAVLEEMVGLLRDNVSDFISADEIRAQDEAFEVPPGESFGGIGAHITASPTPGSTTVEDVFPESPAAAAGLKPGDRILAVDGDPCPHLLKIRGPVGSTVTLTVRSRGEPPRNLALQRASIAGDTEPAPLPVRSRRLATAPAIGYIALPGFEAELKRAERFAEALSSLSASPGLQGLILDLRSAGYGGYEETERIVGMLGGVDQIGAFEGRNTEIPLVAEPAPLAGDFRQVPLVILVGERTADIAELMAASLQQQERATLVGQPTSGTVWGVDEQGLADGSVLVYPVDQTVLPDGSRLGRQGVTPDVMVEEDWFDFTEQDDPYIRAAVALLRKHNE